MRNYDFNYLVEKASVLNEMARQSYWDKMADADNSYSSFKELYKQALSFVATKVPSTSVREKTIEYMAMTLLDVANSKDKFLELIYSLVGRQNEGIKKKKTDFNPDFIEWLNNGGWKFSPQKGKEYVLSHLVKKYRKAANSPEYGEKLFDPDNFQAYLEGRLVPQTAPVAVSLADKKEELHGISYAKIAEIKSAAHPLLMKINKLMRQIRGGKDIYEDEIFNPDVLYAEKVFEELTFIKMRTPKRPKEKEGIWGSREGKKSTPRNEKEWREYYAEEVSPEDMAVIYSYVEGKINSEIGLNDEAINKLAGVVGKQSEVLKNFVLYLASAVNLVEDENESEDFPGYDKRVLLKILDTPEKEDLFADWYSIDKTEKENINKRDMNKALKNFRGSVSDDEWNDKKSMDDELEELKQQALLSDDPKEVRRIKNKIERIKQKTSEEQVSESSVFNYLSEQVFKDSFNPNRGNFVERGFKKPINYAHWLEINR